MLCLLVIGAIILWFIFSRRSSPLIKGGSTPKVLVSLPDEEALNNFIVENKDKHKFIVYHAPWCGHCKEFMPILQKVAQYNTIDDLVVAEIDADRNKIAGINGFPTLKVAKKGEIEMKPFNPPSREFEVVMGALESIFHK